MVTLCSNDVASDTIWSCAPVPAWWLAAENVSRERSQLCVKCRTGKPPEVDADRTRAAKPGREDGALAGNRKTLQRHCLVADQLLSPQFKLFRIAAERVCFRQQPDDARAFS